MLIQTLQVENFRNLGHATVEAHPRLNLFHGDNGAGKTSILEALVVLSRGRSFRTTQAAELVGPLGPTFRVFALAEDQRGIPHRLGLERSGKRWRGRKDGRDLSQLSELTRSLPLVLMEPDSHLLVSGAPEVRRKHLDWGLFHVEQGFLETWRRYALALRQRNAALRAQQRDVIDSLDPVLARDGERLHRYRSAHCDALAARLPKMLAELSANLGDVGINYHRGWSGDGLQHALQDSRKRDLDRGVTSVGPHRADLELRAGAAAARTVLSRGEQKILAAALLLSLTELLSESGERPVLLLDDLASEFDRNHFDRVLGRAVETGAQLWLTGTQRAAVEADAAVFHVEQGAVAKVV